MASPNANDEMLSRKMTFLHENYLSGMLLFLTLCHTYTKSLLPLIKDLVELYTWQVWFVYIKSIITCELL